MTKLSFRSASCLVSTGGGELDSSEPWDELESEVAGEGELVIPLGQGDDTTLDVSGLLMSMHASFCAVIVFPFMSIVEVGVAVVSGCCSGCGFLRFLRLLPCCLLS